MDENQNGKEPVLTAARRLFDQMVDRPSMSPLHEMQGVMGAILSALENQQEEPAAVTTRSSRATEPTEVPPSTSSIYSEQWRLVKADQAGGSEITATVIFPAFSSIRALGQLRSDLSDAGWTVLRPSMLAQPSQSGSTPSTTQGVQRDGPTAGGKEAW